MPAPLPLVSVKIASYNHARFIGKTLQSVLNQSYRKFEIIVVDDCSRDNSVEVIRTFADPRITLLVNEINLGAASASKKAKELCRGKYFCSLDSDDYFHPEKLARQVDFMEAHPEIDVLGTFVHEIDSQDKILAESHAGNWFSQNLDFNQPESWLWKNHLCHSSALVKREVHDRLWTYDASLPLTNDWHNWIRFLANRAVFRFIPEKLTYYRTHTDNVTHKNPVRTYWEYAYISARVFHPFLERIGRRDLIRDNLARFFADDRYPASQLGREYFLRLLLNIGLNQKDFQTIWRQYLSSAPLPQDKLPGIAQLIEELCRSSVEAQRSIESMREDLWRAESEIFKVDRLWEAVTREKISLRNVAKIAYLTCASVVPDILKWPLRPVTSFARRQFRRLESRGMTAAYQIRVPKPSRQHRPRVAHALANFQMGGSSRLVVDLIENLGHLYEQEVVSRFIPAPAAYTGAAVREYGSLLQIRAYLEKFRPDLVHVHYWGDADWSWYDKLFRAAEQLGCKVVENVNTPVTPYVGKTVERYVYVSDYVLRTFGHAGSDESVIHPGSDFALFKRNAAMDIPDNCIGMVYRLEPDKLNLAAIDPFILVAKRRPGTRILLVGSGSFLDHFKQAVADHGVADYFHFTGSVAYADLPALYAQMSVFVAPVWKESFGQVTPFAMSMELPVAGYAIGALQEILGDDEYLARPGDSERLAEIIIKLLDDRSRRLLIGQLNRQRALSLFSIETMIRSYERIYRDVIEEGA